MARRVLTLIVGLAAGVLAGVYLDAWLGTRGLALALLVLLGVAGGFAGAYRILTGEIRWKR